MVLMIRRVAKVEDNLIIWVYGLILMGCLLFMRFKKILKVPGIRGGRGFVGGHMAQLPGLWICAHRLRCTRDDFLGKPWRGLAKRKYSPNTSAFG